MVKVKANRGIHCLHSGATMKPNNNYVVCVFFKNCKAHPSDSNGWEGDEQVLMYFTRLTRAQANSPQCLMCSVGFRYSPQSQV